MDLLVVVIATIILLGLLAAVGLLENKSESQHSPQPRVTSRKAPRA